MFLWERRIVMTSAEGHKLYSYVANKQGLWSNRAYLNDRKSLPYCLLVCYTLISVDATTLNIHRFHMRSSHYISVCISAFAPIAIENN